MGYTTEFKGKFKTSRPFTEEEIAYLAAFSYTRRMLRNVFIASDIPDPIRQAVNLPIGIDAEYFVGGTGICGQNHDTSIMDYNEPPSDQPGLWCQWVPTDDANGIEWDGNEKFYNYVEWLQYIITHFLEPWGIKLSGKVKWRGEDFDDNGVIKVEESKIEVETFEEDE